MFCRICGAKIPDEARFCNACGSEVVQAVSQGMDQPTSPPMAQPQAAAADQPQAEAAKKGFPKWAIALIAVAVICILGIAGFFLWTDHQAKEAERKAWEEAHRTYAVKVMVSVDGGTPASCSPAVIEVRGTDFEGTAVAEDVVAEGGAGEVQLMRGDYTVRAAGVVATDDGSLYAASDAEVAITVEDDGGHITSPVEDVGYTGVAPEDVTDEQIAELGRTLERADAAGEAERYASAVRDSRQARLDQIEAERKAAEEAARKAAEEEAARRAAEEEARRINSPDKAVQYIIRCLQNAGKEVPPYVEFDQMRNGNYVIRGYRSYTDHITTYFLYEVSEDGSIYDLVRSHYVDPSTM